MSILFGVAEPDVARRVIGAHERATGQALDYLEREACWTRRGRAGAIRLPGCGFVAAAFRHRSSRAGDPLLHTHVVVANATQAEDGRWTALDGRELYRHAKTAGFLDQAALRAELSRELGLRWQPVVHGTDRCRGCPAAGGRALLAAARGDPGADGLARGELVAHVDRLGRAHLPTDPDAYLFPNVRGGRMSRQGANELVREAAALASSHLAGRGLPALPSTTPHTLRRTYISVALLANRFDVLWVMRQVGHADSKMTMDVYAQLQQRAERQHGEAFDALVRRARVRLYGTTDRPDAPGSIDRAPVGDDV